jgi:hypothetical protein
VKNEFLAIEDIPDVDKGKPKYIYLSKHRMKPRNKRRINDLPQSEIFLQMLITSTIYARIKQQIVTNVGDKKATYLRKCNIQLTIFERRLEESAVQIKFLDRNSHKKNFLVISCQAFPSTE